MKITTIHNGRFGKTSLVRAERYVKARRADWDGQGKTAIRFRGEDHRNVAALLSRVRNDGVRAGDMPVASMKEMRGVPIMTPEKMLYKIPGPRKMKPLDSGRLLVVAGAPHYSA